VSLSRQFAEIKSDLHPTRHDCGHRQRYTGCVLSACASGRSLRLPGQRWQQLSLSPPCLSVSDFNFKATVAGLHLTLSAGNGANWTRLVAVHDAVMWNECV